MISGSLNNEKLNPLGVKSEKTSSNQYANITEIDADRVESKKV